MVVVQASLAAPLSLSHSHWLLITVSEAVLESSLTAARSLHHNTCQLLVDGQAL